MKLTSRKCYFAVKHKVGKGNLYVYCRRFAAACTDCVVQLFIMDELAPNQQTPRYYSEVDPTTAELAEMIKEYERLQVVRVVTAQLYIDRRREEGATEADGALCAEGMNAGIIPTIIPHSGIRGHTGFVVLTGPVGPTDLEYSPGYAAWLSDERAWKMDVEMGIGTEGLEPHVPHVEPDGLTFEYIGDVYDANNPPGEEYLEDGLRGALPKIYNHTPDLEYAAARLDVSAGDLVVMPRRPEQSQPTGPV
jgi:hypothetical protein